MRCSNILFVLALLILFAGVLPAAADTRYVVDELVITLRLGKSTSHKILKTLKTGTPLEVLDDSDKTYLKVRTSDGVEGYVLRQYISADPPKIQRIKELENLNSSLQEEINTLEEAKNSLEMQLQTVSSEYQEKFSAVSAKSTDLEQNLALAAANERSAVAKYDTLLAQAENVVEIAAERDQLLQKNKRLEADVTSLLARNEKLADSRMIKWFLAGGGVFFFGWIAGKISRKKRTRF